MEQTINIAELQTILLGVLVDDRNKSKSIGSNAVALAYLNSRIELCERLLMFLDRTIKSKEKIDMGKLSLEFKKETVSMDELLSNRKSGVIEPKILEAAKKLKPNNAIAVETGSISWEHFSGRVYSLVSEGKLGEDFGPIKRIKTDDNKMPMKDDNGKVIVEFYLGRYTAEQMKGRKRRKVTA